MVSAIDNTIQWVQYWKGVLAKQKGGNISSSVLCSQERQGWHMTFHKFDGLNMNYVRS